jgi:hypothetical protein
MQTKTTTDEPLKVRLAKKYANAHMQEFFEDATTPLSSGEENVKKACADAYLAGFDRAKLIIIDHLVRSIDPRIDKTPEQSCLPSYSEVSCKKTPSEVVAMIGEMV